VTIAETGEADSTLIVVIYKNFNDTAVKKTKPDYYTKLDSSGKFNFRFLPNQKFTIYVLPNDYTKRYDDSTKTFAFLDTTVDAGEHISSIMLFAYQQFKPTEKVPTSTSTGTKEKVPEAKSLKVSSNLESNQQDLLGNLVLTFSKPIATYDSANAIQLTDTLFKPVTGYTVERDTTLKYLRLNIIGRKTNPSNLFLIRRHFQTALVSGWRRTIHFRSTRKKKVSMEASGCISTILI
jgi:hypothetical protein